MNAVITSFLCVTALTTAFAEERPLWIRSPAVSPDKEAVIVDVRFNGGGNLAERIIGLPGSGIFLCITMPRIAQRSAAQEQGAGARRFRFPR